MEQTSIVYLIKLGNLPYYKIGITKNVLKRITELDIASPFVMELICSASLKNAFEIESFLHQKFWNLRVKGEWFKLTKKEVSDIKSIFDVLISKTETEKKYGF